MCYAKKTWQWWVSTRLLFTKRQDISLSNLAKFHSCKNYCIILLFDKRLASNGSETPAKFQSDRITLNRDFPTLQWRHNTPDGVSNHKPHGCLLNRLYKCRSKKTSKIRVIGLCAGNSPETGKLPAQRVSNAENVSIWWRHHEIWQ